MPFQDDRKKHFPESAHGSFNITSSSQHPRSSAHLFTQSIHPSPWWWQVPARRGYNRYRAITPELEQTSWQMPNPPHMKPVYTYLSQRMIERQKESDREWTERERERGGIYEDIACFQKGRQKMFSKFHSISRQSFVKLKMQMLKVNSAGRSRPQSFYVLVRGNA